MATSRRQTGGDEAVLRIDCADCALDGTAACADCVVTFLVGHDPGTALVVQAAEARALDALARGGLAPRLRHRPRRSA
jgi:hypothetical protein